MPKYSKKEFAELNKIKTKDLSNYIARGKVVLTGDVIDSNHETNKYFMEKRAEFNSKKEIKSADTVPKTETVPVPEQKLNERVAEKNTTPVQTKFEYPPENTISESSKLDSKIKHLDIEKTQNEIAIQQAKIQKLTGESIPTQLVKNLVAHHSKSITVAFRHGADNFLTQIAKKTGLERTETVKLRDELIEIINKAVTDSIDESKRTLQNIVSEYSKRKEVGERG